MQTLVRVKISTTAIFAVMHCVIWSVGGEKNKLNWSYKTMQRYSAEVVEHVNEQIKEDWTPPRDSQNSLGWKNNGNVRWEW